jgi:hypothetical protein
MKKHLILSALVAALSAGAAMAEDGIPSQSKLNSLGLASLHVASDAQGEAVRGKAFVKLVFNWHTAAGEKTTVNYSDATGLQISFDPLAFIANDTNSGAGIAADGIPLFGGAAAAQQVIIAAQSAHQHDVLVNGFTFSEISSSITNAQVIAGSLP